MITNFLFIDSYIMPTLSETSSSCNSSSSDEEGANPKAIDSFPIHTAELHSQESDLQAVLDDELAANTNDTSIDIHSDSR